LATRTIMPSLGDGARLALNTGCGRRN